MSTYLRQGNGSEAANTRTLRTDILGHHGAILWLTGLSGAGKTTLALAAEQRLLHDGVLATVIDGDVLRGGLCRDLGFSREDRSENIRRAGELALRLADAGLVVFAALISPFQADRAAIAERARTTSVAFAEVFINCPLAICERRDPKGLYRRARRGEIADFTGIDSPYEAPTNPQLDLATDRESIDETLEKLTELAHSLTRVSALRHGARAGTGAAT